MAKRQGIACHVLIALSCMWLA